MLLAIAALPPRSDALELAARQLGLARADVAQRLAGTLPRVLLLDRDRAALERHAAALEALGFVTVACDPREVPTDSERVVARTLELGASSFVAVDRGGRRFEVAARALELVQRGQRSATTVETTTTKERRFDAGRAVLSGGLMMTRKVEKTDARETTTREAFAIVHVRDAPAVMLYERRLDYRFLGSEMQPSSFANLGRAVQRLLELAPGVALDDRAGKPGFVPKTLAVQTNAEDLALELVRLAHRRLGAGGSPPRGAG